jgi:endonuclease YncB( thermonuclease family)
LQPLVENNKGGSPLTKLTKAALAGLLVCGSASAQVSGVVVGVSDGDTLTLLEGKRQHKIRLADIDAPEKAQAFGSRSRQSLAGICFRKSAVVERRDIDRYGRIVGTVTCEGVNANQQQIVRGMAWVFVRYAPKGSPLYGLEAQARTGQVGLWRDPHAVPPWEWRARKRAAKGL